MATTSSNVYWSKDYTVTARDVPLVFYPVDFARTVTVTATPEPPHECDVIQRMSEAYREFCR